jgi:hypothetical protein
MRSYLVNRVLTPSVRVGDHWEYLSSLVIRHVQQLHKAACNTRSSRRIARLPLNQSAQTQTFPRAAIGARLILKL